MLPNVRPGMTSAAAAGPVGERWMEAQIAIWRDIRQRAIDTGAKANSVESAFTTIVKVGRLEMWRDLTHAPLAVPTIEIFTTHLRRI